ncbi:MAG: tRNA (adenosine(37)-N6)-threonylcarbamoyltransferase complex dimerization subunit type 1 TsaB [Burkholderiaceae bacterium]
MRLLAFDTSTDAMSIALSAPQDGVVRCWEHSAPGGARASAALIPAIMDLMRQAGLEFEQLDAIAFGRGPGAFTGLRTACSVAQGLAFGVEGKTGGRGVPVLPVDTLLAVAEEARFRRAPDNRSLRVLALLDARMDQVYAAGYAFDGSAWQSVHGPLLERPEDVARDTDWLGAGGIFAGNVFNTYGHRIAKGPGTPRVDALPSACAMLRLAPALLAAGHAVAPEHALPLYIRDKVAQTSSERLAAKAALASCA